LSNRHVRKAEQEKEEEYSDRTHFTIGASDLHSTDAA
jgi:hypothetical protein